MIEKKITYIYGPGRISKMENNKDFAKEMYYGFFDFSKNYDTQIVEVIPRDKKLYRIISKILSKLTGVGIHLENELTKEDTQRIFESNDLFFGNQQLLLNSFLILPKINKKNININVFVMGLLVGRDHFFNKIMLRYLFKYVTRFIFIGEQEFNLANKNFTRHSDKFFYIPFGVDVEFWGDTKINNVDRKNSILFIGNDLNRDYEFLTKLAESMPNINFVVVTNRLEKEDVNLKNVNLIAGNWHSDDITDLDIKNYYNSSAVTIIPLKNTIQPSGQSVALQSMASGTPVIITNTKGFWDSNLIHEENLYLLNSDIDIWKKEIVMLLKNKDKYHSIQKNAKEIVSEKFDNKLFNSELLKLIQSE